MGVVSAEALEVSMGIAGSYRFRPEETIAVKKKNLFGIRIERGRRERFAYSAARGPSSGESMLNRRPRASMMRPRLERRGFPFSERVR